MQRCSSAAEVQRCRVANNMENGDAELQRCRDTEMQRCRRGADVHSTEMQRCRGADMETNGDAKVLSEVQTI